LRGYPLGGQSRKKLELLKRAESPKNIGNWNGAWKILDWENKNGGNQTGTIGLGGLLIEVKNDLERRAPKVYTSSTLYAVYLEGSEMAWKIRTGRG